MSTSLKHLKSYSDSERNYYAKLENENPTGSLKDRMVELPIQSAMRDKKLKAGDIIVEASSGNTGIALAAAGLKLGFEVQICVCNKISPKKLKMIRDFGATVLEYDTSKNHEANIEAAKELGNKEGYYFFNQFENPYHVLAYEKTLVLEILEQLKNIKIDYLVAGLGSGASIIALGCFLKDHHNSNLKVYAISPKDCPTKIEGLHPGHVRGDFKIWQERPKGFEEGRIFVDDESAIKKSIEIDKQEGLSVGRCSGAVLYAATKILKLSGSYLLLFSDSGDRY